MSDLSNSDVLSALDELASLRKKNDKLRREIKEAVEIIEAYEEICKKEWGDKPEADETDKWLQRNKEAGQ